jgi:hypothetical protein
MDRRATQSPSLRTEPLPCVGGTSPTDSYIRVIGFVIDSNAGCTARDRTVQMQGTNSYLELWHNIIRDGGDGIGMPSITDRVNNSLIIGNTLTDLGTSSSLWLLCHRYGHARHPYTLRL